jgi:acyl homoserine lactone synthase
MNFSLGKSTAVLFYGSEYPGLYNAVGRFRKELFIDKLNWKLDASEDCEYDQFDTATAVYATIILGESVVGSFRAISTDQSYLAESVFPQLATIGQYPKRVDTWEISRLGVAPGPSARSIASQLYALMFWFGQSVKARSLVAVTDMTHERHLARLGIRSRRFGPPCICGTDTIGRPLQLVAGEIPLDSQDPAKMQAIHSHLSTVNIDDQTLVLGRSRLSA